MARKDRTTQTAQTEQTEQTATEPTVTTLPPGPGPDLKAQLAALKAKAKELQAAAKAEREALKAERAALAGSRPATATAPAVEMDPAVLSERLNLAAAWASSTNPVVRYVAAWYLMRPESRCYKYLPLRMDKDVVSIAKRGAGLIPRELVVVLHTVIARCKDEPAQTAVATELGTTWADIVALAATIDLSPTTAAAAPATE